MKENLKHIDQLRKKIKKIGIQITVLRARHNNLQVMLKLLKLTELKVPAQCLNGSGNMGKTIYLTG